MEYLPRVIDDELSGWLRARPAVRLDGPRGCGKTTTALRHSGSAVHLDQSPAMTELAHLDPDRILRGSAPRLVDEWRLAPVLWPQISDRLGDRPLPGRYVLVSSATPLEYRHLLRQADELPLLRMRTMALTERPGITGEVSLAGLAHGHRVTAARSRLTYQELAEHAVRGGWPELIDASTEQATGYNTSYLHDLAHADMETLVLTRHQPTRIMDLLTSLSRHNAGDVNLAGLAADTRTSGSTGVGRDTVRAYLDALDRLHAWEPQPAWQPPLRTRARLRHRPRAHLADPALACAALGYDGDRLAADPERFGAIFTAMVIHDLRVHLEGTQARLYHYKDETGLTIDAIIEYPDGGWAALQTSLGDHHCGDAETALHTLRDDRLDLHKLGAPRFLAVITGTDATTTRSRTHIIPLATLTA